MNSKSTIAIVTASTLVTASFAAAALSKGTSTVKNHNQALESVIAEIEAAN